jgi:cation/acetate symporter
VILSSAKKYGIPIPQLTYGQALQDITAREAEMLAAGAGDRGDAQAAHPAVLHLQPAELLRHHLLHDGRHRVAAAHPDALLHHADRARSAQSVAWSLFFIFLLYFSAPAYAAFSKLEVYTNIIGRNVEDARRGCSPGANSA